MRILEIGANGPSCTCQRLAKDGHDVIGIDLREFDGEGSGLTTDGFEYVRDDFVEWSPPHKFDCIISLSAIEHFGLGTYDEGQRHAYYDVLAMRKAWQILEPDGLCIVSVPFGYMFFEALDHWRTYDEESLTERIIQDFEVEDLHIFAERDAYKEESNEILVRAGQDVRKSLIPLIDLYPPSVIAMLIMRKKEVKRLSPDGR